MWVTKVSTSLIVYGLLIVFGSAAQAPNMEPEIYEDNIAEESSYHGAGHHVGVLNSILPNNIFNNGKPFYVEKDPVSGQLNFNSKKSNDLETYINDELLVDEKDKGYNTNDISPFGSNFHDYLNLPVKYTSSKFVYPLVSSSYSNLKYQGNNKNFTSNHKNYTTVATKPPQTTVRTTFVPKMPVKPATTANYPSRGGFKENYTHKPSTQVSSYTLKPRPITSAPMRFSSTSTISSQTKPTKPSIIFSSKLDEKPKEEKPAKFNPSKDKLIPSSTYSPSTTTVTVPPTTRPLFFPTEKPQQSIISTSTFKPIPTSIPPLIFNDVPSSTQKTDGSMTLSEFFNSIGVENPPNLPLDIDASSIVELNVNSLNGPLNPSQVHIPPSTTFQIPKLPKVPFTFEQTPQNEPQHFYPQNSHQTMALQGQIPQQQHNNNNAVQNAQPVSNMNNVIISSDQHSASFIVGSQQAVGSNEAPSVGGTSTEPQFQYGTVIHENTYPEFKPQGFSVNKVTEESVQQNQQQQSGSNFRFPSEQQFHHQNQNHNNGISLSQNQMVVFPPNEKMPVEFVNSELDLNLKQQQGNDNRVIFKNDLPSDLTPPHQRQPQFRPNINRPPPPPPQFALNELIRQPLPNRLPNILPQFRPNAKNSHGHPPYNKEAGTIRLPSGQIIHPQSPPPPPPFRQPLPNQDMPPINAQYNPNRRQPIQDPNRFVNKMSPAMIDPPNRRFYRVQPPPMMGPQMIDRIYNGPPQHQPMLHHGPPPPRRHPYGDASFHMQQQQQYPRTPQININAQPPQFNNNNVNAKSDQFPPQFENEDFYKRPPTLTRQPIAPEPQLEEPSVAPIVQERPKLEQVVTLQMIHSKKMPQNKSAESDPSNPLYVVYPIKSQLSGPDAEESVVVGQRGEHPPQPPTEIDPKSEFQNTPFQIVRNEQEPILMAKDGKQKPIRMQFPYHLVKPDPLTIAELDRQSHIKKGQLNDFDIFNTGEAPIDSIPKVINRGQDLQIDDFEDDLDDLYGKETRRPIAIAYTPTQPPQYYEKYNPVTEEIHDDDDRPEEYPGYQEGDTDELGLPSRGEHYEQDFQAPFFPSVSLGGTVIKNEYEGWNVITPTTTSSSLIASTTQLHPKNQINRSDNEYPQHKASITTTQTPETTTTKKFNPDTFQPELEGGFRPIIPQLANILPQRLVQVTQPQSTTRATTQEAMITPPATIASPKSSSPISTTTTPPPQTTTSFFYPSSSSSSPSTPLPSSSSSPLVSDTTVISNHRIDDVPTSSEKSFFESIFDFNLDEDYDENKARSISKV